MQRVIQIWLIILVVLLSGCASCTPRYHVHGWGYTTGYPMFLPRDNVNYVPVTTVYGVTHYNGEGYSGY